MVFLTHGRAVTAIGLKITARQKELRRGQTLTLDCSYRSSNPKATIFWSLGTHRFVSCGRLIVADGADCLRWMGFVSQAGRRGAGPQQRPLWRRVSEQHAGSQSDIAAPQAEGHLPGLQPRPGRGHQHVLPTGRAL